MPPIIEHQVYSVLFIVFYDGNGIFPLDNAFSLTALVGRELFQDQNEVFNALL